jgi:hypothetical protein
METMNPVARGNSFAASLPRRWGGRLYPPPLVETNPFMSSRRPLLGGSLARAAVDPAALTRLAECNSVAAYRRTRFIALAI